MSVSCLSVAEVAKVVNAINAFVKQYPRIGGNLLAFETVADVSEIAACCPRDPFTGEAVEGHEMSLGWATHGPRISPAHIRIEHMLAAICCDKLTQVRTVWEDGAPHLEVK